MALFGGKRDVSFTRRMNRELLGRVITQQCSYYKPDIRKTTSNLYGEADGGIKYFLDPILLNCLITKEDQQNPSDEFGPDLQRQISFALLKDDLIQANLVPELGDIIMYNESYFEIHNIINNQMFVGKDPNYPYATGLNNFGYDVSVICKTHYVAPDKVNITLSR